MTPMLGYVKCKLRMEIWQTQSLNRSRTPRWFRINCMVSDTRKTDSKMDETSCRLMRSSKFACKIGG